MRKGIVYSLIAVTVVACSAKTFTPGNEQLSRMQQRVPRITVEEARAGAKLYSEKCARCHRLYAPDKFTIAQWDRILPKMFLKARLSNDEQQKLIRDYVYSLSR